MTQQFEEIYAKGFRDGSAGANNPPPKSRRAKAVAVLVAILTYVGGLVSPQAWRDGACHVLPVPANLGWLCDAELQKVSRAEADYAIDRFLGRASGADPRRAWLLLNEEGRAGWEDYRSFSREFEDVLWYQRTGKIERVDEGSSGNRYRATYLAYTGDSNEAPDQEVDRLVRDFQLVRSATVTKIREVTPQERPERVAMYFPKVYVTQDRAVQPRAFGSPSLSVPGGGAPDVGRGFVRPLCSIEMPDGLWVRTPLGWMPESYLMLDQDDRRRMTACDDHFKVVTAPPA